MLLEHKSHETIYFLYLNVSYVGTINIQIKLKNNILTFNTKTESYFGPIFL